MYFTVSVALCRCSCRFKDGSNWCQLVDIRHDRARQVCNSWVSFTMYSCASFYSRVKAFCVFCNFGYCILCNCSNSVL